LIESLTVTGDATVEETSLQLKHGKLEDTTVDWRTVNYIGNPA